MKKKIAALVAAVAVVVVAGGLSMNAVRASGGGSGATKAEVRLQANSVDPLAYGKAKSEQRTDRTRLSIEVEDLSSNGQYSVKILRGTSEIATESVDVDTFGFGELELNTQDGAVNVPVVLAGDIVEVRTPGGDLVMTGTLAPK